MPQFQAGQVYIDSGSQSVAVMTPAQRITSVRVAPSIQRANVAVLGRGKPNAQRPIVGYVPTEASFEYVKSDKSIEQMLGLIHASNITTNLTETKPALSTYGIRNARILFAPTYSNTYDGQMDLKSGVLSNFSLQGAVGDSVKGSFTMSFLDKCESAVSSGKSSTDYNIELVKPEGVTITGIQFSGYGLTGVKVQSFSFGVNFNRTEVNIFGEKFPIERPFTDVSSSLQVQGYTDGFNSSFTGLEMLRKGDPMDGQISITLLPADSTAASTTILMTRPYLDSLEYSSQVGGFTTVSMGFALPIGPNPNEITNGSVLTIN